jgi:hypothetical protein
MLWRSTLNEALLAQSTRAQRKRLIWRFARPTVGLSLACVLAVAVFVLPVSRHSQAGLRDTPPAVSSPDSLAAGLFQIHRDDVRAVDLAGTGLNPIEATDEQSKAPATSQDDYSESDLDL